MLPSSSTTTDSSSAISRSFHNLSSFLSHHLRPWSTFTSSLSPPLSLSSALSRLQINSHHFSTNYSLLISGSAALSLLFSAPFSALIYTLLLLAWLLAHFFRQDPIVLSGRHVDDRTVLIGLTIGTVLVVWLVGMINTLLIGVMVGLLISTVHSVFKDTDALFLDEDHAVSNGLIASASASRPKGFSV